MTPNQIIGKTIYPIPGEFTELESCNEEQLQFILENLKVDPTWFSEVVTKVDRETVTTEQYTYCEGEYRLSAEETREEVRRLISSAKETRAREYRLLDALIGIVDSVEFL